jgi:DNA modification methylase
VKRKITKGLRVYMKHEGKGYTLYLGNSLDVLDTLEENSVDSIVTDPPYEIGFMGKGWDNTGIAFNVEIWKKVLRVLKPGGHMVAFNHSRMFHRMMVAIEDAGFEIRDTIMWLYGSGFPKSMNISKSIESQILNGSANKTQFSKLEGERLDRGNWGITKNSKEYGFRDKDYTTETEQTDRLGKLQATTNEAKQWEGWGTALKPAYEPIVLARKPILEQNIAQNVLKWGVGGINIDECRVEFEDTPNPATNPKYRQENNYKVPVGGQESNGVVAFTSGKNGINPSGRFPANIIHDGSEEVVNGFPETTSGKMKPEHTRNTNGSPNGIYGKFDKEHPLGETYGDSGSASRFFYTAKASQDDRNEGLDIAGFNKQVVNDGRQTPIDNAFQRGETKRLNSHPTVKPVDLMRYLVRLITPNNGTCLDLFMGSGSTGKAVVLENAYNNKNYHFIGIDMTPNYVEISKARIEYAINNPFNEAKVVEVDGQKVLDKPISLFDE